MGFLRSELNLNPSHRIADIGSGTGLLSELFLRNGNTVTGVEPNAEMRAAGDEFLKPFPNFHSVDGAAEATTLPNHCADFVVAGQAFHWFDPPKARDEFLRILVPDGWVVLVWNERKTTGGGFDSAYETIVQKFAKEPEVDFHTTVTGAANKVLGLFFGPPHFRTREFANFQDMSLDDVKARILSSSYMPLPDDPSFAAMLAEAERAFAGNAVGGVVRISYDTRVYYGKMT